MVKVEDESVRAEVREAVTLGNLVMRQELRYIGNIVRGEVF